MKVKGKISEIFQSLQGEGLYLGERQLFVRFFGCNLSCDFCDTKLESFRVYNPEELLAEIERDMNGFHSISFTGGEPLLQKDFLREILVLTRKKGYRNYLETNGTHPESLQEVIDNLDIIAMDLKFPSSTGMDNFWDIHHRFLKIASLKEVFLKAVVSEATSEKDLREGIKLIKEIDKDLVLVLQPNSLEDYSRIKEKIESFRDICLSEDISSCIIPQMHKLIGIK
ncbi:MAG: 7-carboxy-7-deazaguanine synthase QueE [Candidatus Omnitrophota bacterium]